ncbi:MAG TPA: hypothetical protein ENK65_01385 [Helicobacteraceae bacterium]|nr:hypothetical protein [Helicobacteraceae bacterium]
MKHLSSTTSTLLLGSMSAIVMSALSGCEAPQEEAQNKFLVIEQQANGKYVVVEEMPTQGESRAIIRERDELGNIRERFMTQEEMTRLAEQEYQKVQNGTSEVTQAPTGDAGMGLAGTILAVAAGSLLGNMIGNALMGNKNFQARSNSVNKSAYHRNKTATAKKSGSSKKGFFGGSKTGSSSGKSGFFGG